MCEFPAIAIDGLKGVGKTVSTKRIITDDDLKHLKRFREKVGTDCCDAMVITTGSAAYRRKDGIAVVPAALLGA
jgi:predicted AAA+ superfamily ATPase